jgi:hypothetical protein
VKWTPSFSAQQCSSSQLKLIQISPLRPANIARLKQIVGNFRVESAH